MLTIHTRSPSEKKVDYEFTLRIKKSLFFHFWFVWVSFKEALSNGLSAASLEFAKSEYVDSLKHPGARHNGVRDPFACVGFARPPPPPRQHYAKTPY